MRELRALKMATGQIKAPVQPGMCDVKPADGRKGPATSPQLFRPVNPSSGPARNFLHTHMRTLTCSQVIKDLLFNRLMGARVLPAPPAPIAAGAAAGAGAPMDL